MFTFIKNLFKKEELNYSELINRGAIIIDVRQPHEFSRGHVEGAINIPLNEMMSNIREIKQQNKPIITCCRSGARSGNAAATLKSAGIEVYNGGSWNQVQNSIKDLTTIVTNR